MQFFKIIFTLCFFVNSITAIAERADTLHVDSIPKKHSPKKASLFSAIVPGAGQIYNKKYWKPPVIYAAFGGLTYLAVENWKTYQEFKEAFRIRNDNDPNSFDKYDIDNPDFSGKDAFSYDGLNQAKNDYRRYFELTVIGITLVYILNVVDAAVDAHLFYFDVNDDLSLQFTPNISVHNQSAVYTGFSANLRIKTKVNLRKLESL